MKGIFYSVGVGPGEPELMTLKAVRIIKENKIIAVPGREPLRSAAYKIAVQAVPELRKKLLLPIHMPMTNDEKQLAKAHDNAAKLIMRYLDDGKNVVYITLGDPNLYSSSSYLRDILTLLGYDTQTISGVTALSACASGLGIPLAMGKESLKIYTSFDEIDSFSGNIAVMKSGRTINDMPEKLRSKKIFAAENCGMENQRLYRGSLPESSGYFTSVILKDE